jgi:hypothetical protein
LTIDVTAPGGSAYQLDGAAALPGSAPVRFMANWWFDGKHGRVLMRTDFPQIRFSDATVTLTTAANSDLAALIGGPSLQFAILDSYNAFDSALMQARLQ